MRNLLWFLLGVMGGFVAAHMMNKDPRGHEVLAEVDSRITEFTDRIGDAYREQEARISGLVDSAKSTVGDVAGAVQSTAGDALKSAADTAQDAADAARTTAQKLTD
jgi:vacuolar-type H+-ATPase subunit H